MAESVANQVLDGIVTQMSAIVGDSGTTYWYTPTRVAKVAFHLDDDLDQTVAASGQVIYLIRPGDEAHREGTTSEMLADLEVVALLARRFEPASELAADADTPTRVTVVNRLVRDYLRKLLSNVQFAAGVLNAAKDEILVNRDRSVEGWAVAEVRHTVSYSYLKEAP
jgi:hypothetical protein